MPSNFPLSVPAGAINRNTLKRLAPSIFATNHGPDLSNRYRFMSTIEVIDMIADEAGFFPVKASQTRARSSDGRQYAKHMIRLRHSDHLGTTCNVGDELPELIITNAHNGLGCYNFFAGIFRLVCENGMVVSSNDFGNVKVRHIGGNSDSDFANRVINATCEVVSEMPRVLDQINTWKGITLNYGEQKALAARVLEYDGKADEIKPEQILRTRRPQDTSPDLWTVSNRIQENMIKGGIRVTSPSGRRNVTRAVRAVDRDIKLNKAIWSLTEAMANLKGA